MNKQMAVRVLTGVLALVMVVGSTAEGGFAAEAASTSEFVEDGGAAIVGTGPWLAKMACAACVGGILVAGGSSIVGLIAIVGAHAAGVGLCAGACVVGFS